MLDVRALYIDYKEDSFDRDMELSKRKAYGVAEELKNEYNIESFVNPKMGSHGGVVSMSMDVEDDKLIKKVFKAIKKSKPYSIEIEWKDA